MTEMTANTATKEATDMTATTPTTDTIRVLFVEPMEKPKLINIGHTLESLQKLVGGNIEALYPWDDEVAVISCDEAKMNGSLANRCLEDDDNNVYDIICGNFLITGLTDTDFGSISDEMAEKYTAKFAHPEMFFRTADKKLVCVKVGSLEQPRVLG